MISTLAFESLEVFVPPCATAVMLDVIAPQTEELRAVIDFAGILLQTRINATAGTPVSIPTRFLNEGYTYTMRFYRPDGSLLNSRAYLVKTILLFDEDCGDGQPPVNTIYTLIPNGTDSFILSATGDTLINY